MEDEHRETLKKKIQILFQLGKWPDVAKLCASYGEKYGKDVDVDLIRFKSERHMGVTDTAPPAEKSMVMPHDSEPPRPPPPTAEPSSDTTHPPFALGLDAELFDLDPEAGTEDSGLEADDIYIGDPFASAEPAASDPFAADAPGFRMAPEPPPVVIKEAHYDLDTAGTADDELELDESLARASDPMPEESEPDFGNAGFMTIDAEPELLPTKPEPPPVQEPRPEPHPEPTATLYAEPAKKAVRRISSNGHEINIEPLQGKEAPETPLATGERPLLQESLFAPEPERERATKKKAFRLKPLLFIVLPLVAAGALWLALSGKLDFSGANEPQAEPRPATETPVRKRPLSAQPPPVVAPAAQDVDPQAEEQEKAFAEKLQQAVALNQIGDLINAQAALQEAKKIKVTEPLRRLEDELSRKIRAAEELAKETAAPTASELNRESAALTEARDTDTIDGWQSFLRAFPRSDSMPLALRRIAALQKKAQVDDQQQLLQRIQQTRKVSLRSAYTNLSQADVAALVRQSGRPPSQFEAHAHGGATVMLDLTSGLMWTLYNKPMAFDKAKWWANRVSAGYSGWRVPTAEEAMTLRQMDQAHYAGLAAFAIWTGDAVSDQPHTAWVLKLPEGQYLAKKNNELGYVWAVRKVLK